MMRRARLVVAGVALLTVAGCNTVVTGSGAQSGVPTGGPPVMTSEAPTSDPVPPTSSLPEPAVFQMGETGTVTDDQGLPLADITVADAVLSPDAPDEFSEPAQRGGFLSATVTVANLGVDTFTVAPFDFLVRYPGGTRVEYGDGSPGVFGFDDPLESVDVAPGESASGVIAFDVDLTVTGQQIVYTDLDDRILGAWVVP